jgi:hypothetical protein
LPAHDPGDLAKVVEVMGYPRGQELTQRDRTQLGVLSAALKIGLGQSQRFEPGQALGSELREGVKQLRQGFATRLPELGESVERSKRPRLTMSQQQLGPGYPVGALAMNEVPYYIVGAPGVLPLVGAGPRLGQLAEPGAEHGGSSPENRKALIEREVHDLK